jgi:hypothetical protein
VTNPKKSTTERVKDLLALRRELDDRMGSKVDVIGSMVGLKFQAGKLTKRLGITYFVREKIPKAELSPHQRVPTKPRVGDRRVTTDVLAWPPMIEQALPRGTILFDGRLQGTLSCFGVSDAGAFGVSCAHCLAGVDGNPATPTAIAAYANPPGQFLSVGQSVFSAYSPGPGIQGNFGYLDCGLFDLRDQILLARAMVGQAIHLVDDIHVLVGRNLVGVSALNAPSSNTSMREATVAGSGSRSFG